ncbi:PAS domain-containing protein [Cetobacterium somerae]|uniref:PAS domain-containing protein n=1 Tax=Cetobacterium somerae TaxID=188913 RepID=UPI0038927E61
MESNLKNFLKNILNLDLENDFIFLKDSNLKYLYANKKFCELFKLELKDFIGKDDDFLFEDKELVETCKVSDLKALEENYAVKKEIAFGLEFDILKLKVSTGNNKFGVLGFARFK